EWETRGGVEPFPLAAQDTSETLNVAQKLYGREAESAMLIDAFARVVASQRPELVLVTGPAGTGKTAWVHELLTPLVPARGNFIAGKFDRHQRDAPYFGLTRAFAELVRQLLGETEERLKAWRRQMLDALDGNGHLLLDLVPSLELVIGAQPPVPQLASTEA